MGVLERALGKVFGWRGIDFVATHSRDGRIRFLAETIAVMSIEGGGISAIRAALGGEDGDIGEFAEALTRTDAILRAEHYHIQIRGTPEGSAPEKYRSLWNGVQMGAIRCDDSIGDFDPLSSELVNGRGEVYIVSSRQAIGALRERSPEGAQWFEKNFKTPFFSFKIGEAEVVSEGIKEI